MNIINVVNKKLIVEKSAKDNSFIKTNIDAINVIYIVKNDNQNLETPMWEIYIITDFDDNIMIYNSENEFIAKNEFKKLTSKLKRVDDNFKSYYSKFCQDDGRKSFVFLNSESVIILINLLCLFHQE